jgi:predicted dehydrogenase
MTEPMDRRRFVSQSFWGGASLAAAASLAGASRSAARESPNEKIVIGVMGLSRGARLAETFAQQPNCQVAYVCDVDRRRVERTVAVIDKLTGKAPEGVGDVRTILDDQAVDALLCAAPNHWHAPATILACAAGKHVYVEKPGSHNPREGELQIEAATKHRRIVQVGTQRRSWPELIDAMQKLRDGVIGRRLFARAWYTNARRPIGRGEPAPVPEWLDYELWQGPAPRRPYRSNLIHYNWHWFRHWGNGEIGNNGVHGLDLARWGMDVDFPRRVTASGGKLYFDDDQEYADTQVTSFEFGDRMILWEARNWHPRGFEDSVLHDSVSFGASFYGDQGTLVIAGNQIRRFDRQDNLVEEIPMRRLDERERSDGVHVADFLDSIRTGRQPHAAIRRSYPSTLLCHLGTIALRTGRALQCDPDSGRILDDADAMTQWTREYQPGWEPKMG